MFIWKVLAFTQEDVDGWKEAYPQSMCSEIHGDRDG